MISIKFHFRDTKRSKSFPTLQSAKVFVHETQASGQIHIFVANEANPQIINIRNGKREGSKPGTWVPCI